MVNSAYTHEEGRSMSEIRYVKGDATQPEGDGKRIIAHVCNDQGGWGKGFVVAVSRRWPEPEADYRRWAAGEIENAWFGLGAVRAVQVEDTLWVANMVAQHGYGFDENGMPPIRYDALTVCLSTLANEALEHKASVHMPRIGCGLAGGNWAAVGPIVQTALVSRGVDVTVYDL